MKYKILSLLFFLFSLGGALFLVKQNQDRRRLAIDRSRVDPPHVTFAANKSVKMFFTAKISDNSFTIRLQNTANPNDVISVNTGSSPMLINSTKVFSQLLSTSSVPATYKLSVRASRDPADAYGWVAPNPPGNTCGKNGNAVIPISNEITRAQQESDGPHQIQCWADAVIDDITQDYDFNDWLIIFGYEPAPVIPTNTPIPTSTPKPTNTPIPTSTPKPTNTPKPTATSTPKPTNTPKPTATSTPKPTNTPKPTATSTPKPTNTPQPTSTPIPPTNTPVPPTNTPVPPTNTPIPPTNTPVPTQVIAEEPTPTRIILPKSGVEFPSQFLGIIGGIITLLGFLILL